MVTLSKNRLSIDLLEDRLVVHMDGQSGGVAFGKYDLGDEARINIMRSMAELEGLKEDGSVLSGSFSNKVREIGKQIFEKIFMHDQNNPMRPLFDKYVYPLSVKSPLDLSISFRVSQDFFNLPVEFMRDDDATPVATRIPVYKTITTKSPYLIRNQLFEKTKKSKKNRMRVLLISSNTHIENADRVIFGTGRKNLNIYLPEVSELDESGNEIDEIDNIINTVNNSGKCNIETEVVHTDELDLDKFQKLLLKNRYDIIHYSGHGYYQSDPYKPPDSCIFVWKDREKKEVAGINREDLYRLLSSQNLKDLKLVYLSCCQGAETDERSPLRYSNFMGLMDAIVSAGVPNVLGMRWSISPQHARDLAIEFYNALFLNSDHNTVEAALVQARAKTLGYDNQSVWCSPVLMKQDQ